MRAPLRRWVLAAIAVVAADAALLLYADAIVGLSGQLRASVNQIVAGLFEILGMVVPNALAAGVTAILRVLGLGWWQQNLFVPALAGGTGAGTPALGAALAAPVYTLVRRAARRRRSVPERHGAPPHRIYMAAIAPDLESSMEPSTAV